MPSPPHERLHAALDALAVPPRPEQLQRDPLHFPRAYHLAGAPDADVEVAAVVAAMLAFGRVDLFLPVVKTILDAADARGGPAAFVVGSAAERAESLAGAQYRWFRTGDLLGLLGVCGVVVAEGGFARLFEPGPARVSLGGAIDQLRRVAARIEAEATQWPARPGPAFRTFFPHPDDGSACKRWLMLMRWMVRRGAPDLGRWTHLDPAELLMPCDVHVGRVSRLLGLTTRNQDDWRTAEAITASLARFDPDDPTRYDFALAHLGISGGCLGHRDPTICPSCPLEPLCAAPAEPALSPRTRRSRAQGQSA